MIKSKKLKAIKKECIYIIIYFYFSTYLVTLPYLVSNIVEILDIEPEE